MKKIEYMEHITRDTVRANPDKVFIFGDNLLRRGYGGQAKEMRDEPNSIGIPTKKKPSSTPGSFFTDDEFDDNIKVINKAFDEIPRECTVVIPFAGIGTGYAQLRERVPKTFQYLITRLEGMGL